VLIVGVIVRVGIPPPSWGWLKYNNVPLPLCGKKYIPEKDEEELKESGTTTAKDSDKV
jgi:hypothetical protein